MMEFVLALMAAVAILIGVAIDSASCHSQWDGAKIGVVTYGPIQGCMIQYPDGRKLPADAHREVLK